MSKLAEPIVIIISLLLIFGFRFIPPFEGLNPLAMEILGIFLGAMLLWLVIDISWPSLIVLIALIMSPLYTVGQVISMSFGATVLVFVLFSTALCYVLTKAGFFKRCAVALLTLKFATRSPWMFIAMLNIAAIIIGSFMSQLTIFLIMVPIILAVFEQLGYKKGDRVPALITISILLFTSFANFTTPIAHVFPIMAMSLYTRFTGGLEISFFQYVAVGIPLCIIATTLMMLFLRVTYKADMSKLENINVDFLKQDMGPMSRKEKISAVVFFSVIFLWLAPSIFEKILPGFATFISSLGTPTPPMLGVIVLCMVKDEGEPIADMAELFSKGVTWSIFLIIGATSILGDALTHADVGITVWIGERIAPALSSMPPIICVLLLVSIGIIMTNFASDAVTVTLLTSIAVPMVISGALPGLNAAAVTYLCGLAACIGPATAIGSASAAIASGDGYLQPLPMLGWGMLLSLLSGVILTFVGYPLANMIM
jgi:sodium-dependent dicarboxylate transporter 2/3/5